MIHRYVVLNVLCVQILPNCRHRCKLELRDSRTITIAIDSNFLFDNNTMAIKNTQLHTNIPIIQVKGITILSCVRDQRAKTSGEQGNS